MSATHANTAAAPGTPVRRVRRPRASRSEPVYKLTGATEFSDDPRLLDPQWVLQTLKATKPKLYADLVAATTPPYRGGGRRRPGDWAPVYLAFVLSGHVDVQPFYATQLGSPIWRLAGFEYDGDGGPDTPGFPSYETVRLRFAELEDPPYVGAFLAAARELVQLAMSKDSRVGRHVQADGTGYHAHSLIEHSCPPRSRCGADEARRRADGGRRRPPVATKPARVADERVQLERHRACNQAAVDDEELPAPTALRPLDADFVAELGYPEADVLNYRYFLSANGHIYRSRDRTASTRMYAAGPRRKKKVWHGGYFFPFVCDYVGAPIAFHFFEARINEATAYPDSYAQMHRMLGRDPVSVTVDKGLLTKAVFEHNTRRGVATIGPDRKPAAGRAIADLETDEYDRFGPRCKHCGGPTRVFGDGAGGQGLGFRLTGAGDPRIHYRCQHPQTPDCKRIQSISCKREWRLLLPIPRHRPVYQTLLAAHENREAVFDSWRDRYRVAGNSNANRPKRLQSMPCQRLRAAAALVLEWFRICLRQGWIAAHVRRNPNQPVPRRDPEMALRRIASERRRLALPYGPAAVALGIARAGPPPPDAPPEPIPVPDDYDAIPF